eukprot:SAG31_NODE_7043_length_1806_cov_5.626247_2_plen_378_part_01
MLPEWSTHTGTSLQYSDPVPEWDLQSSTAAVLFSNRATARLAEGRFEESLQDCNLGMSCKGATPEIKRKLYKRATQAQTRLNKVSGLYSLATSAYKQTDSVRAMAEHDRALAGLETGAPGMAQNDRALAGVVTGALANAMRAKLLCSRSEVHAAMGSWEAALADAEMSVQTASTTEGRAAVLWLSLANKQVQQQKDITAALEKKLAVQVRQCERLRATQQNWVTKKRAGVTKREQLYWDSRCPLCELRSIADPIEVAWLKAEACKEIHRISARMSTIADATDANRRNTGCNPWEAKWGTGWRAVQNKKKGTEEERRCFYFMPVGLPTGASKVNTTPRANSAKIKKGGWSLDEKHEALEVRRYCEAEFAKINWCRVGDL